MRRHRFVLPLVVGVVTALLFSVGISGSAQAAGKYSIRTTTKTVTQGADARIKGKVIGAKAGTVVTIQQRQPGKTKDWGSGRSVKTDSQGKWTLVRTVKGKFTRDYRACTGAPGRRTCSFRARIEVVPSTTGLYITQSPNDVAANGQVTVSGKSVAELVDATVALEEQDPVKLSWSPIGYSTIGADFAFTVAGPAPFKGQGRKFRVTSPASATRPVSVSSTTVANVYAAYYLNTLPSSEGGYTKGQANYATNNGTVINYTASLSPNGFARIPLDGACRRVSADVFLDTSASADSAMDASLVSTIGAVNTTVFKNGTTANPNKPIKKGDDRLQLNADITNAQSLAFTTGLDASSTVPAPVWFGNIVVNCAFPDAS